MRIEKLSLQYAITDARFLYETTPERMHIEVEKGQTAYDINPIRVQIDTQAARDSIGDLVSLSTFGRTIAQKGRQAAMEATARYTREKNEMLGPHPKTVPEIARDRVSKGMARMELRFLPSEKADISWVGGTVETDIQPDTVSIEWTPYNVRFTYVPFSVDYQVIRE